MMNHPTSAGIASFLHCRLQLLKQAKISHTLLPCAYRMPGVHDLFQIFSYSSTQFGGIFFHSSNSLCALALLFCFVLYFSVFS